MNQHNLLITAADTLFFRDGRPFTMGEDTYAEGGTFPPSPSVLFGALCSAFTSENPNIWQNLTIKGLCLKSSNDKNQWFQLPNDIVVTKKKHVEKLKPISKPEFANHSNELSLILAKESNEKVEESNFFLHQRILTKYLNDSTTEIDFESDILDLKKQLAQETKLGIGRSNDTRISTDGLLYRLSMQRPQTWLENDFSIAVSTEGLPHLNPSMIQLGGEKKVAWLKTNDKSLSIPLPILQSKKFKIYLSTPALFRDGWYPKSLFQKLGIRLLTAAMDKPLNIGGWDVANKQPKPMLKAVPAGTVYYVEADDEAIALKAAEQIHNSSISDFDYQFQSNNSKLTLKSSQQGFGIAFVGNF